MKPLLLLLFCLPFFFCSDAQSLSWFHGDWLGETYFPNGSITRRIVVKLRVTKIDGNRFEAMLDNLYPNNTTVRMERKVSGRIINKMLRIEHSAQVYIRDPRTQNFWRDCTGCDIQSDFSISNDKIEIQLKTTNCNDECNGETTFSRDTSQLDSTQHQDLAKWFHLQLPAQSVKSEKASLHESNSPISKNTIADTKKDTLKTAITSVEITAGDNKNADTKNVGKIAGTSPALVSASSKSKDTAIEYSLAKTTGRLLDKTQPDNAGLSVRIKQTKPALEQIRHIKKSDSAASASIRSDKSSADSLSEPVVPKKDTVPAALSTRTTNLINTYRVSSPHIVIQLFDNAEIDGDVVSVVHNGQLIVNRQSLTHKAITIIIDAAKTNAHHEFVLVADNLGLIPPNTALMRITAGTQKFELEVSSDFDNNSKITIDYVGD